MTVVCATLANLIQRLVVPSGVCVKIVTAVSLRLANLGCNEADPCAMLGSLLFGAVV